jgi:hypothetical protein
MTRLSPVCRRAGASALIRDPHEPVDDLGSLANGKAGGRDTQRNGAQINIGRQPPVQLDLGAAGDSRLLRTGFLSFKTIPSARNTHDIGVSRNSTCLTDAS